MMSHLSDLTTITNPMRDETGLMGRGEITALYKTTVHFRNTITLDDLMSVVTSKTIDGQLPALQ